MKPSLKKLNAVNTYDPFLIEYKYYGSVISTEIHISNPSDNSVVYDKVILSSKYSVLVDLPEGTISNGNYYNLKVRVYSDDVTCSPWSDPIVLYCSAQQTINFTNLIENAIITTANYSFNISYSKTDNEKLETYRVIFSKANGEVIKDTKDISAYDIDNTIEYNISGLSNNTSYIISVQGKTINGLNITSGDVHFSVLLESQQMVNILHLENNDNGTISYSSGIVSIIGESYGDVIIEDGYVTIPDNASISFLQGYVIDNEFCSDFIASDMTPYKTILIMSNGINDIVAKYMLETHGGIKDTEQYIDVTIDSTSNTKSLIRSNYIEFNEFIHKYNIKLKKYTNDLFVVVFEKYSYKGQPNDLIICTNCNDKNVYIELDGNTIGLDSVGDYNSETQKYDIPILIHGKNIIKCDGATTTSNGVIITNNSDGTYTLNGIATNDIVFDIMQNYNFSGTYNISLFDSISGVSLIVSDVNNSNNIYLNTKELLSSNFSNICNISLKIDYGTVLENVVVKPQIEYGTTNSDFEKYKEKRETISLKNPLCKYETFTDKLYRLSKNDTVNNVFYNKGTWIIERLDSGISVRDVLDPSEQIKLNNITLYDGETSYVKVICDNGVSPTTYIYLKEV